MDSRKCDGEKERESSTLQPPPNGCCSTNFLREKVLGCLLNLDFASCNREFIQKVSAAASAAVLAHVGMKLGECGTRVVYVDSGGECNFHDHISNIK
jgi:hypothetical protein